jgi:RimJ/RimL family protein N-acetyltransferase
VGNKGRVRLRRAELADAEILDLWTGPEYQGVFNQFGVPYRAHRDAIKETGLIGDHAGTLIVEEAATGMSVGTISWRAVRYGPTPESAAWNVGINLVPDARGKGLGSEAQRTLAEYLFTNTSVNRIEAMTDIENVAEQRALERAGFVREGVLKGAQFRAGGWHDLVVYAVVRRDDEDRS